MSLPIVELSGSPREQGLQHGRALAAEAARNVEVYFERFRREARLDRAEVIARAERLALRLRERSPDYAAAMAGIAEGAGIPLPEIAALNLRYELLYFQYGLKETGGLGPVPEPDGCTAFALLPEATTAGRLLVGQNWDWIPQVEGALLRSVEPDGLGVLAFTEAGIHGAKIGLNSAGVALAINGMMTTADDWERPVRPFHLRCHEILRSRDFAAAVAVIADEPRACTTNYLVAQAPDRAVDLEAAPDRLGRIACESGVLAHANHFEDPTGLGVEEPANPNRVHSRHRACRLRELLATGAPLSLAALQESLRDHDNRPNSVCRHQDDSLPEEERIRTVVSVIMDPAAGKLWVSAGPPCQEPYAEYSL